MPRTEIDNATTRSSSSRNASSNASSNAKRRPLLLLAVPLLIAVLAACQSNTGISSEDAAAIRDQIQQVATRLDAVEDRLMDLSQSASDAPAQLISEVRAATSDVGAAKTILADVTSQLETTPVENVIDQTDDFLNDPLPSSDTLPSSDLLPSIDDGSLQDDSAPFGIEQP